MKIINFSDKLAVEMICTDSDRLSSLNNFYDSNNVEKQPEYFKVILNNNAFLFKPTKPDVTNFNDFSNIGAFWRYLSYSIF